MSPDRIAAEIRRIADRIDRSEKPSKARVAAEVRRIIALTSGGITALRPQIENDFMALVVEKLEVDDDSVAEKLAIEDHVGEAVYDAVSKLVEDLASYETDYGYEFAWDGKAAPPKQKPQAAPAAPEGAPPAPAPEQAPIEE